MVDLFMHRDIESKKDKAVEEGDDGDNDEEEAEKETGV